MNLYQPPILKSAPMSALLIVRDIGLKTALEYADQYNEDQEFAQSA